MKTLKIGQIILSDWDALWPGPYPLSKGHFCILFKNFDNKLCEMIGSDNNINLDPTIEGSGIIFDNSHDFIMKTKRKFNNFSRFLNYNIYLLCNKSHNLTDEEDFNKLFTDKIELAIFSMQNDNLYDDGLPMLCKEENNNIIQESKSSNSLPTGGATGEESDSDCTSTNLNKTYKIVNKTRNYHHQNKAIASCNDFIEAKKYIHEQKLDNPNNILIEYKGKKDGKIKNMDLLSEGGYCNDLLNDWAGNGKDCEYNLECVEDDYDLHICTSNF